MKLFLKRKWIVGLGVVALVVTLAYAATSVQRFVVGGDQIYDLQQDGWLGIVGPFAFGNSRTAPTLPTTTTGSNFSFQLPVYNPTSSSIAAGSVLIASDTGTGYVNKAPATDDLTTIIGVAASAISATSKGWMIPRGGGLAVVLTTGTVSIGHTLVSTAASAGYLIGDPTPTTGADVGTALTAGTAAGGSTLVLLH